jgi:Icc-related predicted phosphoesterase
VGSTGWSNRTPWHTQRELDEEDLGDKIEAMAAAVPEMDGCIFNLHCPPFQSGLDRAPELDRHLRPKHAGGNFMPVGSTAVRAAVERYQPPLALFGHVHESRAFNRIGKTLCINPGSEYEAGILLGARIDFEGKKIVSYSLTSG